MARWQYQQRTEPLVEIVTSDKWAPLCPSRIIVRTLCLTTAILAGSCFLDATPIITIDKWQGSYPSRLTKFNRVQLSNFIVNDYAYVTPDSWYSSYPIQFLQLQRNREQGWIAVELNISVITIDEWIANYPNRLDKLIELTWIDRGTIDPFMGHNPIPPSVLRMRYFRRYLDDPEVPTT